MLRSFAIALASAAAVVMALPATPASAGGDVVDRGPIVRHHAHHRHHHRVHRVRTVRRIDTVVRYVEPEILPVRAGPRIRRGSFHGRFIGGNYAYDAAYQGVLTETNNAYLETRRPSPFVADLVDPDNPASVYNSGVPYSRSESVPEHGGAGIYDKSIALMPAPTRGVFVENRTRDAYVYGYDYETENPACWSRQVVRTPQETQIRSVWACPGR